MERSRSSGSGPSSVRVTTVAWLVEEKGVTSVCALGAGLAWLWGAVGRGTVVQGSRVSDL